MFHTVDNYVMCQNPINLFSKSMRKFMFLKEIIYFLVNYLQHGQTNRYLKHPTDLKLFLDALVSKIPNYFVVVVVSTDTKSFRG